MNHKQMWVLVKQSLNAWVDDYAPSMGAALAYYTLFSIAPLLLIVLAVAGYFFGADAAHGAILAQLDGLIGREGAVAIDGLIKSASEPQKSATAAVIGFVMLLVGATTVFGELQDALDRIWRAPAKAKATGIFGLLRARLLSFGMILGIAFLLMVSLVVSAAVSALGDWWGPMIKGWEIVVQAVNFVVSFAIVTILFAMIYKIMPRVKVAWHDVWIGAAVTSMLFTIGKLLIGLYIGKSGIASGFGAAGSLVVLLLWVYYSAQIFLVGAEFTWAYSHSVGSKRGDVPHPAGDQPCRSTQEPRKSDDAPGPATLMREPSSQS